MGPVSARPALLPAAALAALAAPSGIPASASAAGIALTRIATVDEPTDVAQAPGDPHRLYVSEKLGRVRVIRDGRLLPTPFLDVTRNVSATGERGFLSLAFAPDFARSRLYYVDYIDPRRRGRAPYSIPRDNPFVGRRGARAEIYSYGLRNPWRFAFDRATGDMIVADVGQDEFEEVDFAARGRAGGANYGWRVFEGR